MSEKLWGNILPKESIEVTSAEVEALREGFRQTVTEEYLAELPPDVVRAMALGVIDALSGYDLPVKEVVEFVRSVLKQFTPVEELTDEMVMHTIDKRVDRVMHVMKQGLSEQTALTIVLGAEKALTEAVKSCSSRADELKDSLK